jgi:hypothetical protein
MLAIGDEVGILDAHSGRVLRTLRGLGGLAGGAFARDGRWITAITGSGMDELIDVESGQRIGVPMQWPTIWPLTPRPPSSSPRASTGDH